MRRLLATIVSGLLLVLVVGVPVVGQGGQGGQPSLLPSELLGAGDPRSEGAAPGLVGDPLLVLAAVLALGVATAAATYLLARLARRA